MLIRPPWTRSSKEIIRSMILKHQSKTRLRALLSSPRITSSKRVLRVPSRWSRCLLLLLRSRRSPCPRPAFACQLRRLKRSTRSKSQFQLLNWRKMPWVPLLISTSILTLTIWTSKSSQLELSRLTLWLVHQLRIRLRRALWHRLSLRLRQLKKVSQLRQRQLVIKLKRINQPKKVNPSSNNSNLKKSSKILSKRPLIWIIKTKRSPIVWTKMEHLDPQYPWQKWSIPRKSQML